MGPAVPGHEEVLQPGGEKEGGRGLLGGQEFELGRCGTSPYNRCGGEWRTCLNSFYALGYSENC